MRRDIKKSFWVNSEEDYEIKMKAQAACLSEAEFFRQLCRGYTPVSKPDERFWQAMDLMRDIVLRGLPEGHTEKYCKVDPENKNRPSYFEIDLDIYHHSSKLYHLVSIPMLLLRNYKYAQNHQNNNKDFLLYRR